MSGNPPIRVLLVEDDEDDFLITRDLLRDIPGKKFALDWVKTFETGLATLIRNEHDIALVDYRLGAQNGVQLLRAALDGGCQSPIVLLTGLTEHQTDLEAMQAGAADYLVKDRLEAQALERSLRYALQRRRAAALAAAEQARLAAFGTDVGLALTRRDSLQAILDSCASAMVTHLGAAVAEISTLEPEAKAFERQALAISANPKQQASSPPARPLPTKLDLGWIVEGRPVLIRHVLNDERIPDQEWIKREKITSYAAYPLFLESKLVGLMSIYTSHLLTEQIGQEMGSVAYGIALCIERKRSEEALDASETKYRCERKMAENAIQKLAAFPRVNPNPVLEFASDGTLTYANDAARELAQSLGKQDVLATLPPNAATMARDCLATGQKLLRQELKIEKRTISWSFFPIAGSQVVHCYGNDITEVLSLEAQFRHAQKLESVGQMAAGIAHDFNNVLTVIQGYSESLLLRCSEDRETTAAVKQIADSARRAAALTRQLLMFSRKQVIQPRILGLNTILRDFTAMLRRLLGEDVVLQAEYTEDLPSIEADRGMLEQIVMNLAVNARDAMPKGGTLFIGTGTVTIGPDYVSHHPDSRAGDFICMTVTDTGSGMDQKTLDRIFEPFFSTKAVGKGTGLGLATVYGIVKQHLGWIEVLSEVGRGTTFKIYFPPSAIDEEEIVTQPLADPQAVRGRNEIILLVEDEPVVRELVSEVLQQYEYRVLEASSGVEALRVWDEHDGQIDLLLTDMVMPEGMTGRELASQLKKRKPELKVIYTSGYSPEMMGTSFGQGDTVFLPKPYLPPQLAHMVRQSLDGNGNRRTSPVPS
jgi:signal transduction histidine kinase/DNA-binding response OmpR family regulator